MCGSACGEQLRKFNSDASPWIAWPPCGGYWEG